MRFEVPTAVKMLLLGYWVVRQCGLAAELQLSRWKQYVSAKHWYLPTSP
jgi:hypothetical protein